MPAFPRAAAGKPLGRIVRLSAAFLASNVTRGAIAFALSLVAGRALGIERFGRWVLCTTWASTLTVAVDLGFGLLLTRDAARECGNAGVRCGSAIAARLALAVPAAMMIAVMAARFASDAETVAGLRAGALLGIAGAVYGCVGSTYRSRPRWVPAILILETSWTLVQLALSWIVLHRSPSNGILWMLIVATGVQLAEAGSALVLWPFAFAGDPIRIAPWPELRALVRRALPFAVTGIVANLQTRVAPLMLGYLSTQSELGSFAAASRFATTARLAPSAVSAGALPVLSKEYSDDPAAGRAAYASFHRAMVALAAVAAVPCLVFAPLLLRAIYGPPFVRAAPALIWIGIGLLPALTNSAKKIVLYASGGERAVVRWSGVALVIQVVTAFALIPRFGSVGAAASLAIGEAAIWWPLRDRVARTEQRSNTRREPSSTHAPGQRAVADVPDPAAAR